MKKIIVVGGGAGGLELVTKLGRQFGKDQQAEVTLVDRSHTHIWKPLLHEVATGSLDVNYDGLNYRAHSARHNYHFQLGSMIAMDAEKRTITLAALKDEKGDEILPERQLDYDIIVLAVGSISNDFGTEGVAEHCYFLDSHRQAERFQQALLNQFLKHQQTNADPSINLAIVGGGATGIELSAELYHVTDLLKSYGMEKISTKNLNVVLIEAGERILPALPERIASSARRELQRLGITVMESTRIVRAEKKGFVTAEDKLIEADLMIWAAGVKAPNFVAELGFETTRSNQILAKTTLQTKEYDNVFVIGDCCACEQDNGKFVPPRAQSAHQMASLAYKNIQALWKGEKLQHFRYKDHGSLVNLSNYSTVGSLMGNLSRGTFFVEGRLARLVYISLYRLHLIAIHGWLKALLIIVARRIGRVVKPKMKLH